MGRALDRLGAGDEAGAGAHKGTDTRISPRVARLAGSHLSLGHGAEPTTLRAALR